MDTSKKMFFVAVMPPDPLQEEVRKIKLIFRDNYGSGHALNSPAHLTLIPPFYWPANLEPDLIRSLDQFSAGEAPFTVSLSGFGAFSPRVIFIDVALNDQLVGLQHRLKEFMDNQWRISERLRDNKPFNPHMTVAFRDLSRQNFHRAWAEFREKTFNDDFSVNKIILLWHDHKQWNVHHQAHFTKN